MSVRDPVERVKSAYNWRKYKCYDTEDRCFSPLEPIFYNCYTTLNAFSEGSCDGPLCGDGWDETSDETTVWNRYVKKAERRGRPLRSCEDAFRTTVHGVGTKRSGTWPSHRL